MKLDFYCLRNCDTCRKAQKALVAAGHVLNMRDIRGDKVPEPVLRQALTALGRDAFLATRSPTWRTLSPRDQARDPVELMLEYPVLMKRPLILGENHVSAGWAKPVQAKLLG